MSNGNPNSYELLKIWVDFAKWFVVSVALAVISLIIDSGFKDREIGVTELNEYGRYVDLIVDYNKVSERRLLAQFFANVTPSEKLRERWNAYYEIVNAEYDSIKKEKTAVLTVLDNIKSGADTISTDKLIRLEMKFNELEEQAIPRFNRGFGVNEQDENSFHFVRPSETLQDISRRYEIPVDKLVELNPFLEGNGIKKNFKTGTVIRVK
jgi:hypothetical protein